MGHVQFWGVRRRRARAAVGIGSIHIRLLGQTSHQILCLGSEVARFDHAEENRTDLFGRLSLVSLSHYLGVCNGQ